MNYWYELWDSVGSSLVGHFDTQEQALRVVRGSLATHGLQSVMSLVLIRESNENEAEDPEIIAQGEKLMLLVQTGPVPSFGIGSPILSPRLNYRGNEFRGTPSVGVSRIRLNAIIASGKTGMVTQ